MPQALVPIISAIGSAVGGVVGASLIMYAGAYAAGVFLVGSLALSQYQKRKAERAARAQYDAAQVDRLVNIPASVAPRELVLGRIRKGGPIIFRGTTGYFFNSQLFVCIALAGHEIDGVEQIYFNETPITLNGSGLVMTPPWGGYTRRVSEQVTAPAQVFDLAHPPIGGSVQVFKNRGIASGSIMNADGTVTYSGEPIAFSLSGSTLTISEWEASLPWMPVTYRVVYEWTQELSNASVYVHLGGDNQPADAAMMASFPPGFWTAAHQARGVAYLAVLFTYDENAYPSGPPNITARIRGAKCYDPRTGLTQFSETAAIHMLHVLTHPQFGKRTIGSLTAGEIARFSAAANVCDTAMNYGDGVVQMYRSAGVWPFGAAARDAFDDLAQAMGGSWAYASGEVYLRPGVWQAPVMDLTDDDLAVVQRSNDGSVSQQAIGISVHRPRLEKINTVVARIWDESAQYVQTPLPPLQAAELIAADGAELSQEVTMPAVFYWRQAMHVAGIMLRDDRDPLTVTLAVKMTAYPLELFDSVRWTLSRYGFVSKEFLLIERRFDPSGVLLMTFKETSAAIYAVGAPFLRSGYASNTQLPSPWLIQPPTITSILSGESVLVIQSDGTILNGVKVNWAAIVDPSVSNGGRVEVQWRGVGVDAWQSVVVPGGESSALLVGAGDLQWITIRARCRSSLATSDWTPQVLHQVVGKSAPPPDISSLSISGAVLSWSLPYSPPDLAGYVFRFHYGNNVDWGSAAPLHTGLVTASPWEPETRPGGVVTILGKAQDTSGNQSKAAAVIVMNLGDPPIANVVENWDFDALGWPFAAGLQVGWTLVGGKPTATALDSLYGTGDQSFYGQDTESFYEPGSFGQMVYVTNEISVSQALAGSLMTLLIDAEGTDLTVEYRLAGPSPFYGTDAASFYGADDDPLYDPPGEWRAWPGQLVAANEIYQFRVVIGAGIVQGRLLEMVLTVDAPDIVERVDDLVVASGGTLIPYTKPFSVIKNITATLQANVSSGRTVETTKSPNLAPKIRVFDASHSSVGGASVDLVIYGY